MLPGTCVHYLWEMKGRGGSLEKGRERGREGEKESQEGKEGGAPKSLDVE